MNSTESQLRVKAEALRMVDRLASELGVQEYTRAWPLLAKLVDRIEQAILAGEERGRQQALKMIPDALRRIEQLGLDAARGTFVGVDPAQVGEDFTTRWVPENVPVEVLHFAPSDAEAVEKVVVPVEKVLALFRLPPELIGGSAPPSEAKPAEPEPSPDPEPQRVNFREWL